MARGLDLAADANQLTRVGRQTGNPNMISALTDIKPTTSIGYFTDAYSVNNKISYEAARQMQAIDGARQFNALNAAGKTDEAAQVAAKFADDPIQLKIFDELKDESFEALDTLIDDIGKTDTIYGDIARTIRQEGRVDFGVDYGGVPSLGRTANGGAATEQLVEKAAERLAKYNIEDYVALTDRMAVNKEVLNPLVPDLNERIVNMYVKPVSDVLTEDVASFSQKMTAGS